MIINSAVQRYLKVKTWHIYCMPCFLHLEIRPFRVSNHWQGTPAGERNYGEDEGVQNENVHGWTNSRRSDKEERVA